MMKLLTPAFCALLRSGGAAAIDLNGLRAIGPVASFVKTDSAVTLICADGPRSALPCRRPISSGCARLYCFGSKLSISSRALKKGSFSLPRR
jgi:hypothetical protein